MKKPSSKPKIIHFWANNIKKLDKIPKGQRSMYINHLVKQDNKTYKLYE